MRPDAPFPEPISFEESVAQKAQRTLPPKQPLREQATLRFEHQPELREQTPRVDHQPPPESEYAGFEPAPSHHEVPETQPASQFEDPPPSEYWAPPGSEHDQPHPASYDAVPASEYQAPPAYQDQFAPAVAYAAPAGVQYAGAPGSAAFGEPPMEKSRADSALVLAILSWFTCGVLMSLPAVILASGEMKAIRAGRRAAQAMGRAKAAFWVAVTNLVLSSIGFAGILLALFLPTIISHSRHADPGNVKVGVAELAKVMARIRTDTGSSSSACLEDIYVVPLKEGSGPEVCGGLANCSTATPGASCWGGPYMTAVSNDPWDNPYRAHMDTATYAVTITSSGPDGVFDTSDDTTFVQ